MERIALREKVVARLMLILTGIHTELHETDLWDAFDDPRERVGEIVLERLTMTYGDFDEFTRDLAEIAMLHTKMNAAIGDAMSAAMGGVDEGMEKFLAGRLKGGQ